VGFWTAAAKEGLFFDLAEAFGELSGDTLAGLVLVGVGLAAAGCGCGLVGVGTAAVAAEAPVPGWACKEPWGVTGRSTASSMSLNNSSLSLAALVASDS